MEQGRLVGYQGKQQRSRIEAQFAQTGRMEPAGLFLRSFGPQPQERRASFASHLPCPQAHQSGKAGTAACFVRFGEDFMQPAQSQAAAERAVDPSVAQRKQRSLVRRTARLKPFQALAQLGKDKSRIAHVLIMFLSVSAINSSWLHSDGDRGKGPAA